MADSQRGALAVLHNYQSFSLSKTMVTAQMQCQHLTQSQLFDFCVYSTDEGEGEDLGEVHIMENGYEVHAPSPVIPPSLLAQQVQSFYKTTQCIR